MLFVEVLFITFKETLKMVTDQVNDITDWFVNNDVINRCMMIIFLKLTFIGNSNLDE